jgi:hypothetical protein
MKLARFYNYLIAFLLFFLVIIPVGLLVSLLTFLFVFFGFVNSTTKQCLASGEEYIRGKYISDKVSEMFKKNTIDL